MLWFSITKYLDCECHIENCENTPDFIADASWTQVGADASAFFLFLNVSLSPLGHQHL